MAPEFALPANLDPVTGTHASLYCDLSAGTGCKPNANVVLAGCTLWEENNTFHVSANLGSPDVGFRLEGRLGPTGGTAFVSSIRGQQVELGDPRCDIIIEPNQGQIIPGGIWASFICRDFADVHEGWPAQSGCAAVGKFIFENCDK